MMKTLITALLMSGTAITTASAAGSDMWIAEITPPSYTVPSYDADHQRSEREVHSVGEAFEGIAGKDGALDTLNGAIRDNSSAIYQNELAIDQDKKDIEENRINIGKNTGAIEKNADDIEKTRRQIGDEDWLNSDTVQNRINDLNKRFDTIGKTNLQPAYDYADKVGAETLDKANAYTDSRYNHLNSRMKKLRGRVDAGVAGATAIGSLTFDTLKANSISGGFAIAKNKVAGAFGYQRNFNDKWRARVTVSVSDQYIQGGGSLGYSW